MPELVPARIRRDAQGIGAAGAAPTCARRKAFWVLFRREKDLAGRRPVKASASIQCTRIGATHGPDREVHGEERLPAASRLRNSHAICSRCRLLLRDGKRTRLNYSN